MEVTRIPASPPPSCPPGLWHSSGPLFYVLCASKFVPTSRLAAAAILAFSLAGSGTSLLAQDAGKKATAEPTTETKPPAAAAATTDQKPAAEAPKPATPATSPSETKPVPPRSVFSKPADKSPAASPPKADAPKTESPKPAASATPAPASPDGKVTFNFRYQPWPAVLDWFAEQAGLSLLMESPPPGTFNYTDTRSYTPTEALDVLNGVLADQRLHARSSRQDAGRREPRRRHPAEPRSRCAARRPRLARRVRAHSRRVPRVEHDARASRRGSPATARPAGQSHHPAAGARDSGHRNRRPAADDPLGRERCRAA